MCTGSYTIQTDDARSQISCAAYTAPTLVCIAEGVGKNFTILTATNFQISFPKLWLENEYVFSFLILDILPPQPQELEAMNITDKSFILKWTTVTGEGSSDERTLYQV